MVTKVERLRAELGVAEAEDEFVAAKDGGGVTREQKAELRELRRDYRENFRVSGPGTVQPGVVKKKVG